MLNMVSDSEVGGRNVASLLKEMKFQPLYNLCANNIEWTKETAERGPSDVKYVFIFVNKKWIMILLVRKIMYKDFITINYA